MGWPPSLVRSIDAFGECGDSRCGCYRLWRPEVRERFRHWVVGAATDGLADLERVRYVTVGCGLLLADFEILCGLVERGLTLECVVAIDRCYEGLPPQSELWAPQVCIFMALVVCMAWACIGAAVALRMCACARACLHVSASCSNVHPPLLSAAADVRRGSRAWWCLWPLYCRREGLW